MTTAEQEVVLAQPLLRRPQLALELSSVATAGAPDSIKQTSEISEIKSLVPPRLAVARKETPLAPVLAVALLFGLWELAPRFGWMDKQFFPPPSEIIRTAVPLIVSGELFLHIAASLARTLTGFVVAIAVAIPLGLVLAGRFPRIANNLRGLLSILGQINAFSLFPLFVLFFGIGEVAKFGILFWSCLWPVLACTITGVRKVDPIIIKGARALGCDQITLLRDVMLPAALPAIFSGARVGATVGFLMLAAAEMIGAQTGLGWLIHNASMNYFIPRLYVAAVTIATLGIGIEVALLRLERHVIRWRPEAVVT
jgi:NitT/TauT family transport system permease protein